MRMLGSSLQKERAPLVVHLAPYVSMERKVHVSILMMVHLEMVIWWRFWSEMVVKSRNDWDDLLHVVKSRDNWRRGHRRRSLMWLMSKCVLPGGRVLLFILWIGMLMLPL